MEKSKTSAPGNFQLICILFGMLAFLAYAASKFTNGRVVVVVTILGALGFFVSLLAAVLRARSFRRILTVLAATLVTIVLGSYAILFAGLYLFQDTIADHSSSFFQPQQITAQAAQALTSAQVEALDFTAPDGMHLRGWLVKNAPPARAPLLIYFGGSGQEVSGMIPYAQKLAGWSVALVNYRGFGFSEGVPTQAAALLDALTLYDALVKRGDVDPKRVAVMGYSLGTGVAVHLSAQRPVAGVVLAAPYDRLSLIGAKPLGVYAPVAFLMKPYFDSLSLAPGIRSPLLCLVGSADTSIPPERSFRLVEQWGGKSLIKTYPGEDHDLLFHTNPAWTDIQEFLRGLFPANP